MRTWVSYISKKGKVLLHCPESDKAFLSGMEVFILKHLNIGVGFKIEDWDQFLMGCWPK